MADGDYSAWLGRTQEITHHVGSTTVERIAATLSQETPRIGDALPPLWHWAFFEETVSEGGLGADGHPKRGGFLPPVVDRNRMWAGSSIELITPLRVGTSAARRSTIARLEEKTGRTGALLFITVRHEISSSNVLAIRETQELVYRAPSPPKVKGDSPLPPADWRETVQPTETLLFRFSAVTFNSHRIHYDWPYATGVEGYPGLVVHGPLLAISALAAFRRANPGAIVRSFSCRGLRPLFAPTPFEVGGRITEPGKAELWAGDATGPAQTSSVIFTR
jgi:itaconyl-CoA hydratase/mesaconyl-C4 CoA hydratase